MPIPLAAMIRRANPRRTVIPLRPIKAPAMRATDLYQVAFRPVIERWQSALPGIQTEYERTLASMTTDAPSDLERLISQAEADSDALLVRIRLGLAAWAARFESWHRSKWRANILSATKVELGTLIGASDMRETLEALIERNVALVSSVSDEARRRIADAVFRGLTNRTPSREVAKELAEAIGMSRKRALRIAADQNVKIASALNDERRRQAGITSWEWIDSEKKNFRPEHRARDGYIYTDDPAMVGKTYQGKKLRKVPEDKPGELPYCGCTSRAVLILE